MNIDTNAPVFARKEIVIHAPVEKVWELQTDIENWNRWQPDITSAKLEGALEDRGFHLDTTLMSKMMRALIYYVEETQLHNLDAPDKPLKKSQSEAYTQAWERHPHGDHDDTPPEWREYK